MKKKSKSKPTGKRKPQKDFAQIALETVERAIDGKLAEGASKPHRFTSQGR
jgi:hypothetical protein